MATPLIGVAELAAAGGEVSVLDIRYRLAGETGHGEYLAGHVPGAAYVDLDTELAAPPGQGGRHPLPEAEVFCAAMRRAGVSRARPVVVYDDWFGYAAARAWWLLRHYGHPQVHLLDGGWSAWADAGLPVETDEPGIRLGDFAGSAGAMPVVDATSVRDVEVLIDARAAERFRGDVEPIDPVAGHIPGAVNGPTTANLVPGTASFRSPAELARTYRAVGAAPGVDVAVYCGSGVTAAHDVLALEIAGIQAALYPGSWSEWITDPARPVALGGG